MALTDIKAYLPLPHGIGTSGQPTVEQFAEIKAAGYEAVSNLAMPTFHPVVWDGSSEERELLGNTMLVFSVTSSCSSRPSSESFSFRCRVSLRMGEISA